MTRLLAVLVIFGLAVAMAVVVGVIAWALDLVRGGPAVGEVGARS